MNRTSLLFIFFLFGIRLCVFSETLILKSGDMLEGKVVEETDEYVRFTFEGITLTYERESIAALKKEKTATHAPAKKIVMQGVPAVKTSAPKQKRFSKKEIVIDEQDNHLLLRPIKKINEKYRVFGITLNEGKDKNDPFNHIDLHLVACPYKRYKEIFQRDRCEERAAQTSSFIPVICKNKALADTLKKLSKVGPEKKLVLRLQADLLEVKEHTFKGNPITSSQTEYLLLRDFSR